jgi:hypothetical protein
MKHRIITAVLTLAIAGALLAHGGLEHVTGFVKAITADSITVETAKHEMVTILLMPKMEVTKSSVKADIKDLKVGDRVVVHAGKNKDGKLEAHEVAFGPAAASATSAH